MHHIQRITRDQECDSQNRSIRDSVDEALGHFQPVASAGDSGSSAQKPFKKQPPLVPPKPDRLKTCRRSMVNAVYYPSWKMYKGKPPSSLELDRVTHVFYAFLRVNTDGTLRLLDEWGDLKKIVDGERGCLAAFAKMKRQNPHVKTLISIGGASGSGEFPALAASEVARDTFASQLRYFVDTYSFDGIDIDWEHPTTPEDGIGFLKILRATRATLPSPEYLITTALPTGEYSLGSIDLKAMAQYVDFLNLMAYDFVGSWTFVAGNHAQLYPLASCVLPFGQRTQDIDPYLNKSGAGAVDYLVSSSFPPGKILMGIPAYARYFPLATAVGMPSFGVGGEIDYDEFPEEWISGAMLDDCLVAASFVDGEKGFVSYDVPATVRKKARWAVDIGLGGLFYWTGSADRTGRASLVTAGWEALQERRCETS